MAYHAKPGPSRRSGGFFLIILGALIFVTAPIYLADSPGAGAAAIAAGFGAGGAGFYLTFVRGRRRRA
ncbi:MAG: hypothetical protein OXU86_03755 [Thaumarchaeota archaeon]|nr:hypothetical protein [Nitrososphaerota archaeon]RNJ72668.1 MAG: hypothetical protein EB832_03260 [Thaumarchaeota archaeon S14]RNJ72852.1 MAG: hypothetical protein EB833_04180 [Thaumarchaeota archaeon S13]MDD9809778.1 hypothetical protein [Nitrososphaerota archaeon]MDD9814265.1 hypothetical protein [Nitrososphaerota archaeon]